MVHEVACDVVISCAWIDNILCQHLTVKCAIAELLENYIVICVPMTIRSHFTWILVLLSYFSTGEATRIHCYTPETKLEENNWLLSESLCQNSRNAFLQAVKLWLIYWECQGTALVLVFLSSRTNPNFGVQPRYCDFVNDYKKQSRCCDWEPCS